MSSRWSPAGPPALRPALADLPSPCSASAVQSLLLERLCLAWFRRRKDVYPQGREGDPRSGVARSLCYRILTHSGAPAGHRGVSGWVTGQGHSAVSTHLFRVRGYCLGGVLGCLQPGEGATAPFSVL